MQWLKGLCFICMLSALTSLHSQCLVDYSWSFDPEPISGVWNSNEEVTICLNIDSEDWIGGGHYIHGIVPTFGNGWDLNSISTIAPISCSGDGGQWGWYGSVTSTTTGQTYGPGFFYESPEGGTDPDNPGDNYGDHCPLSETLSFCWQISTNDLSDCVPGMNLDIIINTLSDDESGASFLSPLCAADIAPSYGANIECCDADAGAGSTLNVCQDDAPFSLNDVLTTSSSGTWFFDDVNSASLGSTLIFDPALSPPGTYFYAVDGTVFNCTDYAAIDVAVSTSLDAGESNSITLCTNGGIVDLFSLLNGTPDAGGMWTDPNGNSWSGPYFGSSDIPGDYTYFFNASGSCTGDQAILSIETILEANAGEDASINICACDAPFDMNSFLNGSPSSGGTWYDSNGLALSTSTFNPANMPEGIYAYEIAAENCYDIAYLTISFSPLGEAGIGGVFTFCEMDNTEYNLFDMLSGSPDLGGQWSGPSGSLSSGIFNPSASPEGNYTYVFSCGTCTDVASFNISISESSSASVEGDILLCAPQSVPLTFQLDGIGPFNITLEDQDGGVLSLNSINDGHIEMVQPLSTTVYTMTDIDDLGAECDPAPGEQVSIVINPPPSVTISGDQDICPGQSADLLFTITGNGPFIIEITDSSTGQSFFSPPVWSGDVMSVTPTQNTTYSVVNITDSSSPSCSGIGAGSAQVNIVTPPALNIVSAGGVLCAGESGLAEVNISGSWTTYDLVLNTGFSNLTFTDVADGDILSFEVFTSTPSSLPYCFTELNPSGSNGCTSLLTDTCFHLQVLQEILTTNEEVTCDPSASQGSVSFEIGGGTGPYTVDGVPIIGNTFTSPTMSNGSNYSFEIDDAEGCGPVIKSGVMVCDCQFSTPGFFQNPEDTITVCSSSIMQGNYDFSSEVIQNGDIRIFVIHDGTSLSLGNVLSSNYVNPDFVFQAGMNPGEVYYVTALIGDNNGSSVLDFDDPCLVESTGIPVIFLENPEAILHANTAICDGEEAEIQIDFTGNGPWSAEILLNGNSYLDTIFSDPSFTFYTGAEGTYEIGSITDSACPGMGGSQVDILTSPLPTATILNGGSFCEGGDEGPEVQLTGEGPWELVYTANGMFDTLITYLQTDILPVSVSGLYDLISIRDVNCVDEANGAVQVDLIEQPTAVFATGEAVCEGDSVLIDITFSGQGPFDFQFSVDGTPSPSFSSADFNFSIYSTQGGTVEMILLDNGVCDGIGLNTEEIVINPLPEVSISVADNQVCEGDLVDLVFVSTGIGPYEIEFLENTQATMITVPPSGNLVLSTMYFTDTEISIVEIVDEGSSCKNTSTSSVSMEVLSYPPAFAGPDMEICGNDTVTIGTEGLDEYEYLWSPVLGVLEPSHAVSPFVIANSSGEDIHASYTLSVSNQGCVSEDEIAIVVESSPVANFTINPFDLTAVNPVANFFNLSNGQNFYLWTIQGDTVSTNSSFSFRFPEDISDDYEVCLSATSTDAGCTSEICKDVEVTGAMSVYLPNAFSPNGDGINDLYGPETSNVDRLFYVFRVYDRWGQVIFETKNPSEKWDGTVRKENRVIKNGHYVYQIIARDVFRRQIREFTGEFHLIR